MRLCLEPQCTSIARQIYYLGGNGSPDINHLDPPPAVRNTPIGVRVIPNRAVSRTDDSLQSVKNRLEGVAEMKDKTYLIVSGAVFALWTIGQLARLIFQIPVQVGTMNVPIWPNILGVILALALCTWAFWLVHVNRQK